GHEYSGEDRGAIRCYREWSRIVAEEGQNRKRCTAHGISPILGIEDPYIGATGIAREIVRVDGIVLSAPRRRNEGSAETAASEDDVFRLIACEESLHDRGRFGRGVDHAYAVRHVVHDPDAVVVNRYGHGFEPHRNGVGVSQ